MLAGESLALVDATQFPDKQANLVEVVSAGLVDITTEVDAFGRIVADLDSTDIEVGIALARMQAILEADHTGIFSDDLKVVQDYLSLALEVAYSRSNRVE